MKQTFVWILLIICVLAFSLSSCFAESENKTWIEKNEISGFSAAINDEALLLQEDFSVVAERMKSISEHTNVCFVTVSSKNKIRNAVEPVTNFANEVFGEDTSYIAFYINLSVRHIGFYISDVLAEKVIFTQKYDDIADGAYRYATMNKYVDCAIYAFDEAAGLVNDDLEKYDLMKEKSERGEIVRDFSLDNDQYTEEMCYECYFAALEGNVLAQIKMGDLWHSGVIERNAYDKAARFYKMAADQDNAEALYKLGMMYVNYECGNDMDQGFRYLERAAEQGHYDAQKNLAIKYAEGSYKGDCENYIHLLDDVADAEVLYSIGKTYINDIYDKSRFEQGVQFLNRAAEKGSTKAQMYLGWTYQYGQDGFSQSIDLCLKYYNMASEQGEIEAQRRLAEIYYEGDGVEKSKEMAIYYYTLAADQGDLVSKVHLDMMKKEE